MEEEKKYMMTEMVDGKRSWSEGTIHYYHKEFEFCGYQIEEFVVRSPIRNKVCIAWVEKPFSSLTTPSGLPNLITHLEIPPREDWSFISYRGRHKILEKFCEGKNILQDLNEKERTSKFIGERCLEDLDDYFYGGECNPWKLEATTYKPSPNSLECPFQVTNYRLYDLSKIERDRELVVTLRYRGIPSSNNEGSVEVIVKETKLNQLMIILAHANRLVSQSSPEERMEIVGKKRIALSVKSPIGDWAPEDLMGDILKARDVQYEQKDYGPYVLAFGKGWKDALESPYWRRECPDKVGKNHDGSTRILRDRVESVGTVMYVYVTEEEGFKVELISPYVT